MNRLTGNQGSLFPGTVSRWMIAAALGLVVVIRLLARIEDPPFPLNDPAVCNLLTLILCFIAGLTAWIWFCFYSAYAAAARRTAMLAPVVLVGLIGLTVFWMGFNRWFHVSGSMALRLAPSESKLANIERDANAAPIDLKVTSAEDFSQFLGPERSGWIAGPELARDWSNAPPKLLWKRPLGAGWSAFAAVNGYAVTLEQRGPEEWVTCYAISTGEPVWGNAIAARHENPMGGIGPRSTPTIHAGRVYALGATGVLRCLDGGTGQLVWSDDLRKRYGVFEKSIGGVLDERLVQWGRASSPLLVDGLIIVPGGGPVGKAKNLVAFDAASGKLVWESENIAEDGTADQISYASPASVTLAGRRQIVVVNESTVSGHEPATGERLWSFPWPGNSSGAANNSQAVAIDDAHVLLSKGYSGGAELLELSERPDKQIDVKSTWKSPRVLQTKFTNVVVHRGHAFGLSEGILECVELANGNRRWKNGRYGHGQILGVGELLLVLSEEGELHLVELTPQKFTPLASLPALTGKTWNNLCLVGHRLLIRNAHEAACYELP